TGAPPTVPPGTERIITRALEARPEDRYSDLSVMVNDLWGAQAALAEPEPRVPVKPRSPVAIRSRPSRFPLPLGIAGAIVAGGVIAVIVGIAFSGRIVSHFRARVTAPALSVAPVERSLISPPDQPAPIEPASVPSSAATAPPGETSPRPESQPVEEPAPVVTKSVPAPAPAPVPAQAPAPPGVQPERTKSPGTAPVLLDRTRSPDDSRPPPDRPPRPELPRT